MRTQIKVSDLSLAQWDYVQANLRRDYEFAPTTVRVCVELELSEDISPTHIEMPVRVFMAMMSRLQRIGAQAETAAAALTPDALPDFPGWEAREIQVVDPGGYPPQPASDWEWIGGNLWGETRQRFDRRRAELEAEWERVDPEGVATLRASAEKQRAAARRVVQQARAAQQRNEDLLDEGNASIPASYDREPDLVRNDCAFCKWERSYKDDNHAPECPYWTVGPGSL